MSNIIRYTGTEKGNKISVKPLYQKMSDVQQMPHRAEHYFDSAE